MNEALISAAIALALAVGFGSAWTIQNWRNLDAENHRITLAREQEREVSRLEQARSLQVLLAQNDARKRESQLRLDSDTSRLAVERLLDVIANTVQTARTDPGTCPERTDAVGIVLAECVGELRSLAEKADRHVSDVKTLADYLRN